MNDLDALEALAKAALWTGDWHDAGCNTVECKYPEGSELAGEHDEIAHPVPLGITGYIAAVQPKTILSLIAEVRALRDDNKRMRGLLKRPIAMKIGGSMYDGFSEMVAVDALTRPVARAKRVTVYYGEKRDYIELPGQRRDARESEKRAFIDGLLTAFSR